MQRLLFGISIIIMLIGCSERETLTIDQEIQKFAKPPQIFTIQNDKVDTLITTNGIKLIIQPNSLEFNDGSQPDDSIQIELKEVFDKLDMILNGVGTMSEGTLLESFGMVNIKAISNGRELRIKNNSSIKLLIPNKRRGTRGELFYGQLNDKD
jgi:hypothetical protein